MNSTYFARGFCVAILLMLVIYVRRDTRRFEEAKTLEADFRERKRA